MRRLTAAPATHNQHHHHHHQDRSGGGGGPAARQGSRTRCRRKWRKRQQRQEAAEKEGGGAKKGVRTGRKTRALNASKPRAESNMRQAGALKTAADTLCPPRRAPPAAARSAHDTCRQHGTTRISQVPKHALHHTGARYRRSPDEIGAVSYRTAINRKLYLKLQVATITS